MKKYKILMTYKNTEGLELLLNHPEIQVDIKPKPTQEELQNLIRDYEGLLIRSEVKVTKEIIESADKLKLIVRAGTGVDNVDINAANKKGIIVMNVPGGNTISACEHTIGLILAMVRNIPQAHNSLKSGRWEREKFVGNELQGKTLGLIGLGRIGSEVAKRMKAFDMRIIAYDPYVSEEYANQLGVELKSFEDLLKESDIISLHIPKTDSTKNLINKETISKMKDGVKIVNCARGGIINENDLYEALKSGKVSSAALDVFEKEPPDFSSSLFKMENVVFTPHLGASTEEAQVKIAQEVSLMIVDFFTKGVIKNAVNIPSIDFQMYEKLKPYIKLVEKIGLLQSHLILEAVKQIEIQYVGEIFNNINTYILTSAYVKSFLSRFVDIQLNFINSQIIAKERGISIKETKLREGKEYKEYITAKVETSKSTYTISGTLISDNNCRIIEINGMDADLEPEGNIIVVSNIDKPGIIGKIGTILGDNNINIAKMFVARKIPGGEALTFINVDSEITSQLISSLEQVSGINMVKFIKL
ncbi:MAG: phosphoglycerate dehydrogenase [Endomicrobia bacterium]|nr:phosphoglycerate dehydrogenase [Endomicrobiia bacterium]